MDNRQIPTLSTDNYISEAVLKLDAAYAYFLASDYSQSNVYRGNVTSMKYLLIKNSDNQNKLASEMTVALETYLKRYFDKVSVFVDVVKGSINVSIEVTDSDGVSATLENALAVVDGKLDAYSAIDSMLKK